MSKALTFALDFDDTLTAAPDLWKDFVDRAVASGHRVICVTARRDTEENRDIVDDWLIENNIEILSTYFTSLRSKAEFMKDRGVKVDIWIDDSPSTLVNGH